MRIITLTLAIALLFVFVDPGLSQDVSSNILTRVFRLKYKKASGSSFTIEVQDKQYLITAKHLVEGIKDGDKVEILKNDQWVPFTVKALYIQPPEVDIVVLVLPTQISPSFPLEPTMGGIMLGQNMYFLGFPFGLQINSQNLNYGYPLPLVKSGVCSAFLAPSKDYSVLLIDGINNPGFSGGPIVFVDHQTKKLKVAGVVRGYRLQQDKVFRRVPNKDDLADTNLIVQSNSGIVVGYDIRSAVDVIKKNPIGPSVKH